MNENRLPFKAYKMLYNLDGKGKTTWASKVKDCLCKNGFADVWHNQGVGNECSFLKVFKQRIIDCRWQDWHDHVQESERVSFYRLFETSPDVELYLLTG